MIKKIIFLILFLALIASLAYRIDLGKSPHERIGELMYFPSGNAVRLLCVGFYAPFADLVWLRFIQYYGEHRLTDLKYGLMYHILDVLTTLDPYFIHAWNLGALMLTHDAQRPDQALQLLKKGIDRNPTEWRLTFMYGFINYLFLYDYKTALVYFRLSSMSPGAADMPKRWAGYIALKRVHDIRTAYNLWLDMYNNTVSPEERKIALMYLNEIKMEFDIEFLNKKIADFETKMGRKPYALNELINAGLIDSLPVEPHGYKYVLKNGQAYSTWKKK